MTSCETSVCYTQSHWWVDTTPVFLTWLMTHTQYIVHMMCPRDSHGVYVLAMTIISLHQRCCNGQHASDGMIAHQAIVSESQLMRCCTQSVFQTYTMFTVYKKAKVLGDKISVYQDVWNANVVGVVVEATNISVMKKCISLSVDMVFMLKWQGLCAWHGEHLNATIIHLSVWMRAHEILTNISVAGWWLVAVYYDGVRCW